MSTIGVDRLQDMADWAVTKKCIQKCVQANEPEIIEDITHARMSHQELEKELLGTQYLLSVESPILTRNGFSITQDRKVNKEFFLRDILGKK